jgi:hypothetical protein
MPNNLHSTFKKLDDLAIRAIEKSLLLGDRQLVMSIINTDYLGDVGIRLASSASCFRSTLTVK